MNFLDKYFPKKFKTRVVRDDQTTTDKLYIIEYTYYRFIPVWCEFYNDYYIISPINRWYYHRSYGLLTARFTKKEVFEQINKLKSINDINNVQNKIYQEVKNKLAQE